MSDTPYLSKTNITAYPHPQTASQPHTNVEGWERIGSLAGGVLLMGKGIRRGGVFGLLQLAMGGFALARGITGQCAAKSALQTSRDELDRARSSVERAGDDLMALKRSAKTAANSVVDAGTDALKEVKREIEEPK